MSVKVLDMTGGGTTSTVACGINWAMNNGASVINLSLGGNGGQVLQDAVKNAWDRGALVVAAAGNSGANSVDCPACYDQVIAVSAIQQGRNLACFSNFGSKVELTAPGVDVLTTNWPNTQLPSTGNGACRNGPPCTGLNYCAVDGTSFAAPFVSGIAALVWDYNAQLSNQQIRDALDAYVFDIGTAGRDQDFGYGEPNAAVLLDNVASVHTYTLKARWEFFFQSGNEGTAKAWVIDQTTLTDLISGVPVGDGLTVNAMAGHRLSLYFDPYYNDGSHWVYVARVDSAGGVPSYSDEISRHCGRIFTFPAIPASSTATYFVSVTGNPFSGQCG